MTRILKPLGLVVLWFMSGYMHEADMRRNCVGTGDLGYSAWSGSSSCDLSKAQPQKKEGEL